MLLFWFDVFLCGYFFEFGDDGVVLCWSYVEGVVMLLLDGGLVW